MQLLTYCVSNYKAVKLICKVWAMNRSSTYFHCIFLPIIEHSVVDTLKFTSELESRQKKNKTKTSGFKKRMNYLA